MEESLSRGFCMKTSCRSGSGGGTKCGRWNPTSEQVKVLTDLFSSGLRTPTTDQIQKISSQLSLYGKIESKNVFYWFQNHKARERHKRRKVSVDKTNNNATTIISSPRSYAEIYHSQRKEKVSDQQEKLIQTLQLFPLNSFGDELCKEKAVFHYSDQIRDHPPLDLRLSFV